MAILMSMPGFDGTTGPKGFEKCVTLTDFAFGVNRPVSMDVGDLGNRASTTPDISCISVTKMADEASSHLFQESLKGSEGCDVIIYFTRAKDKKILEYQKYELSGCVVSGYAISHDSGDTPPSEEIELSFSKLRISHTNYDKDDKPGNTKRPGYDLASASIL